MSRGPSLSVLVLLVSACAEAKRSPVRVYTTSDGLALDTFRGFTMFWIVGGEALRDAVSKGRGAHGPAPSMLQGHDIS